MRPPQIVIAVIFSLIVVLTIFSLRSSQSTQLSSLPSDSTSSSTRAFFSFHAPFSLFPPSALISLTHDNKTAFLARPAAFGPSISPTGLSGQVWIDGGFDGISSSSELGCSDVQGWSSSYANSHYASPDWDDTSDRSLKSSPKTKFSGKSRHEDEPYELSSINLKSWVDYFIRTKPATDDYLYRPLIPTNPLNLNERKSTESDENHSDIQSIQEAAEIAGKVVLLNRGGCGFLEKVKWSQRRGAIALIVGANTKGGPLVQMYARGDTSSITIPSVFTSYTTAKLLYNLAISRKSNGNRSDGDIKLNSNSKNHRKDNGIHVMYNSNKLQGSNTLVVAGGKISNSKSSEKNQPVATENSGWFSSLFAGSNDIVSKLDQSRPPSSGQLNSILVDERKLEDRIGSKTDSEKKEKRMDSKKISTSENSEMIRNSLQRDIPDDDFIIGIQDWRDPDLVGNHKTEKFEPSKKSPSSSSGTLGLEDKYGLPITHRYSFGPLTGTPQHVSLLKGGSITPSSGEYALKYHEENPKRESNQISRTHQKSRSNDLNSVFDNGEEKTGTNSHIKEYFLEHDRKYQQDDDFNEGLWVTLSSSSGASPFLDTLLVLVVSPLVTLTVVYILLLIRSRYRQQKWRAPKSVVERLPVRTYQRMNPIGPNSPQPPNFPTLSVTTPLLQDIPKSYSTSQIAKNIPESSGLLRKSIQKQCTFQNQVETQTECVVCLEEYIDGVSRIMALPCGHEFHVECITPWLTTRRRTCPMCKGDVVRSLARASRYDTFKDDNHTDEEHNHVHPSQRMTYIPSSSGTPTNNQHISDLESGRSIEINNETEDTGEATGWRGLFMGRIMTILTRVHPTREDRNR